MYKPCQTQESARRQREIAAVVVDMMLEKPFSRISVTEFCQRAGIPRRVFYRYFEHKEDLLDCVIDTVNLAHSEYEHRVHERGVTKDDMKIYFDYWLENRKLLDAFLCNNMGDVLLERGTLFFMNQDISRFSAHFHARPEMKPFVLRFAAAGLFSMLCAWHREGYRTTPAQMARVAGELLTHPFFIPDGKPFADG